MTKKEANDKRQTTEENHCDHLKRHELLELLINSIIQPTYYHRIAMLIDDFTFAASLFLEKQPSRNPTHNICLK